MKSAEAPVAASTRDVVVLVLVIGLLTLVKLAVSLLLYTLSVAGGGIGLSPLIAGGDDGTYYVESARAILEGRLPGIPTFFSYVVAFVFGAFGENVLAIRLLNLGAGVGLLLLLLLLLRHVVPNEAVRPRSRMSLALLVTLYPSLLLFESISIYRDVWIGLLYVLTLMLTMLIARSTRPIRTLALVAVALSSLGALALFRWYAALAVILSITAWFVLGGVRRGGARTVRRTVVLATLGVTALMAWRPSFLAPLLTFREQYEATGAGSNLGLSFTEVGVMVVPVVYLYSVISNILGPLPWQISGALGALLMLVELPLLLVVGTTIYVKRPLLSSAEWYLVLNAVVWFLLIGFFNDNIGTAARLRIPGWLLLLLVFSSVRSRTAVKAPESRRQPT